MKRSTILAVVALLAGVAVIVYFATRPRSTASTSVAAASSEGSTASRDSRAVSAVGVGLTGIVSGIVDAASSA